MEKVLSGKPVAALLNKAAKKLIADYSVNPKMLLILMGNDPASIYYVDSIVSNGVKLGCNVDLLQLPEETKEEDLLSIINKANSNSSIHGIMIQKPLPKHINDIRVNVSINPKKDMDCIHPENLGKIMMEADCFLPCTPAAVFYMMRYYNIDPVGKNVVVLGRSNVVGKPLANILLWKKPFANATVTVCHSRTNNLNQVTRSADILISAIGKANFVTPEMIKENSVLLDVGINELHDAEGNAIYVGDVSYSECIDKSLAITPVPGGIGRITTSVLFLNLVKACLEQQFVNKTIDEYITLIFNANHDNN